MAAISSAFLKKITESISINPLEKGEFRDIAIGHHISLESNHNENHHLFQVQINGETIYVYGE